jgi:hypothetical protein
MVKGNKICTIIKGLNLKEFDDKINEMGGNGLIKIEE